MEGEAPRRWFQFSLRALLLALTVFAVWLGVEVNRMRRQREAVQAILAAGGKALYDYQIEPGQSYTPDAEPAAPRWLRKWIGDDFFRDVVDVDLNRTDVGDAWLTRLNDLPRIKRLNLAYTPISDAGIENLANLGQLTSAILPSGLTDRSLAHLAQVSPALSSLTVDGAGITDAGLAEIARFRRLKTLILSETSITDAGLEHLENLSELEMLWLAKSPITDRGLSSVVKIRTLKRLFLIELQISDAGVKRLGKLPLLQRLGISQIPVTDAGLQPLKRLKWLSRLELYDTLITDDGTAGLAAALPMCKISTVPSP